MAEYLERTTEANRGFHLATGEIPITVSDDARLDMFPTNGAAMDPFADDTPLACGVENPESCESCT